MRKALLVLLCMVLALTALVSCGDTHTHTYEADWSSDAENHWHAATCEHTTQKKDLAAHVDANEDEECDVCGYSTAAHHFATILSSDETGHWYACTDEGCTEKKDFAPHVDEERDGECDECFRGGMHKHSWNTANWQSDENQHWNPSTCGSDCPDVVAELKGNVANHVDVDEDGNCDVCNYDGMHRHTFDETEWVKDETGHWYADTCADHDRKGSFAEHVDEEGDDFACDVCGYVIHEHTFADTWTQGDGEHYKAATCAHNSLKKDAAPCVDTDSDNECDVCGAHVHNVDDSEWVKDETGHWHNTTCSHDPAIKADFSEHIDENVDNTCDVCGFHAHSWATEYSGDTNGHWIAAICPGHEDIKKDEAPHVDADSDTYCDICELSTIGPIAGVNHGTWDKTNYTAAPTGTLSMTGDDAVAYTVTWKSYDVATYDADLGKMIISKKTVVDSIANAGTPVDSFVKDGRTYQAGTVLDKSEQSWTSELLTKITADDAGISPNTLAFQFRTNITINGDYTSRHADKNMILINLNGDNDNIMSLGTDSGKVWFSISQGWVETQVEEGETFVFAVRFDRVTEGGKTSYLMSFYINGAKVAEKSISKCATELTFKTYSASRDLEFVMTDIYCDSYGIRYEGATETTTTSVWEKDGAFSATEIADGTKYDIEWFATGALTTDDVTGVVTSQDKRIAIKSIKDAEGNETTITYSGVTYKAGECYIPKGWLGLGGTAFWGSAPAANFTATEAEKTDDVLYEFKTTLSINDYGTYAGTGVGNVLEMRLYSGNTEVTIVYFTVGGGPSRFVDWKFNGSDANGNARGKLQNTLEIRIVVTESAEAGKVDIAMYGKTQGTTTEALVGTKTVDAFEFTKVAFDAPSNARYQTVVFENTTFTKYVTELTPEPAPAE